MKKVFASHDSAEVGFLKSVLEDAGIECLIRNETQAYPTAFPPELWVLRDEDMPEAEQLCRSWRAKTPAREERWRCGVCGEEIEIQFDACWKCGTRRAERGSAAVAPSISAPEEKPFPGARKLFEPWLVVALGLLAFGSELYWAASYATHPTARLYYPIETALGFAGNEATLEEGWRRASNARKWLRKWHEMGRSDIVTFGEQALRDTIAFARRYRFSTTNIIQLRANLAVLLAERGTWQSYTKELELLARDTRNSNFVIAVQAVYGTNANLSLSGIDDPLAVMGNTWFRDSFEARWLEATSEKSAAARLRAWLKTRANQMHARHFAVISIATVGQLLGLGALLWLLIAGRRFNTPRGLSVPWRDWEGLALFFTAWFFGILFYEFMSVVPGGSTFRYYNFNLVFWTPLIVLLWLRYWRLDRTSLRVLFGVSPMGSRGITLMAAGFALFFIDSIAFTGLDSAAHALGLTSHWAEGLDEAEFYEPWPSRSVILLNGVLWAPIGEEIIFRGVLFPALRNWMSMSAAALVSALVFAGSHYYSFPAFLGLTAFGYVSAMAAHYSGSLVPSIVGHVLINLVMVAGYSWVFAN